MLTRVSASGFKAIGKLGVELELRPLTLLVGENGTGKSSLLDLLALTAQSASEQPNLQELVMQGRRIDLLDQGSTADGDEQVNAASFLTLCHELDDSTAIECSVDTSRGVGFSWTRSGRWGQGKLTQTVRVGGEQYESAFDPNTREGFVSTPPKLFSAHSYAVVQRLMGPFVRTAGLNQFPEELGKQAEILTEAVIYLSDLFARRLETISETRELAFATRTPGDFPGAVGRHGEGVLRIVADSSQVRRLNSREVQRWLFQFGLGNLTAGWSGGRLATAQFLTPQGNVLDVCRASSGERQMLIFLVALLMGPARSGPDDRVLLIEEPELHLHPRWEMQLAELFAERTAAGTQIIATTHSDVLVSSVLQQVRSGKIPAQDLAIYEFTRDKDEHRTVRATRLEHTAKGNLIEWISSFRAVDDELHEAWLDSVPEIEGDDRTQVQDGDDSESPDPAVDDTTP